LKQPFNPHAALGKEEDFALKSQRRDPRTKERRRRNEKCSSIFFFFSFNFPWTEAKFAFLFCFSSHRAVPLPRPPWSAPWDLRLSGGLSELEEEEVIFFEIQKPIKKTKKPKTHIRKRDPH